MFTRNVLSLFTSEKPQAETANQKRIEELSNIFEQLNQSLKVIQKKARALQKVNSGLIDDEKQVANDYTEIGRHFKSQHEDPLAVLYGECLAKFGGFMRGCGNMKIDLAHAFEKGILTSIDNFLADTEKAKELKKEYDKNFSNYTAAKAKTNREKTVKKVSPQKILEAEREEASCKQVYEDSEREVTTALQELLANNQKAMVDSLLSVYMSALRTHIDNSLQSVRALKGNLNKTAKRQNLVYGLLNPVSSSENRAPSLREVPGSLSMEPSSMPFLASSFDDLTATSPQTPPRSPSLSPFTNLLFPSATDSPPKTSVPNLSPGIEREAVVQQDAHHQNELQYRIYEWENGDRYEGEWKNNLRHGKGILYYKSGNKYEGEWKDDMRHGQGQYHFASGDKYEGHYYENKKHGHGIFTFTSGERYEGDWQNDKQNGKGKYTYATGNSYEGEWQDDQKHGHGLYRWTNGECYEGQWLTNLKHGSGVLILSDGQRIAQVYEHGKLIKEEDDDGRCEQ